MNRDPFITGQIYHVYNRGTDKRTIFSDTGDRRRFLSNLYEFNNENPAAHWHYKLDFSEVEPRKKVVEIFAYCLMPNHYHLMLRQISDGGVTLFMRKLGTGYTMYFNKKYERSGSLFQGRYKAVAVRRDEQLRYLPHYIHANPLGSHSEDSIEKLARSRWNSAGTYLMGGKDPVIDTEFLRSLFPEGYGESLADWLASKNTGAIAEVALDAPHLFRG